MGGIVVVAIEEEDVKWAREPLRQPLDDSATCHKTIQVKLMEILTHFKLPIQLIYLCQSYSACPHVVSLNIPTNIPAKKQTLASLGGANRSNLWVRGL